MPIKTKPKHRTKMPTKNTASRKPASKTTKKTAVRSGSFLSPKWRFNKQTALILMVVFAAIGGYLLYRSYATSSPIATIEAETMALPAGTAVISDSTASGTQAIKFTANGTATGTINLPSAADSLTITAKGTQCKGAPAMVVAIDGAQVGSSASVSATSWTAYNYTKALTAGSHTVAISFTNYSSFRNCAKQLFVDKAVFMGTAASTSGTTVSINDSTIGTSTNQFNYSGSWTAEADSLSYLGDKHYSNQIGAYYQVSFNGTQAKVYTSTDPVTGIAGISIDGGPETMVDTYTPTDIHIVNIYTSPVLVSGAHTIKIRVTGTKSTNSTGTYIGADRVDILGSTTSPTPTPTPPTASSQIYWGSWIDGNPTYDYIYPGQRPGGHYSSTTEWGDAPWDYASWDKFESNAGKKVSIEHWNQTESPMEQGFASGTNNLITSRGAIPLMTQASGSYSLADIAAGKYDSQLTTWAQGAKSWGKPFLYRFNWEMNGTWYSWGSQAQSNPANYVNAWKHFHDIVAQQGASNVTWVWCPNTEYTGSTSLSSLYPGDAYVDWTCIDGYNKSSSSTDWRTFSQVFQQTYTDILSIAPTKPVMIGETSSLEIGGSKANWITDALTAQLPTNFPKIKALVWFNQRFSDNGTIREYEVESSATSQQAFHDGIASPYYAPGGTYGSLPLLTKVQPLP